MSNKARRNLAKDLPGTSSEVGDHPAGPGSREVQRMESVGQEAEEKLGNSADPEVQKQNLRVPWMMLRSTMARRPDCARQVEPRFCCTHGPLYMYRVLCSKVVYSTTSSGW